MNSKNIHSKVVQIKIHCILNELNNANLSLSVTFIVTQLSTQGETLFICVSKKHILTSSDLQ